MRTRKRTLYVANEATYGTDPDADGSDYMQVPTLELGVIKDGAEQLATGYFVGRAHGMTAPVIGRDGWSLDFTVPLMGLATAAGDGTAGSSVAVDWLDSFLQHIFGTATSVTGEGLATAGSATTCTLDAATPYANQDILPVYQAAVPAVARTQLNVVTAGGGTTSLTLAPGWSDYGTNPPTGAAQGYGYKLYQPSDEGGLSLAFVYADGTTNHTLLGGRCTACTIKMDSPGQIWKMAMTFSGDSRLTSGKGSMDVVTAVTTTPLKGLLSPIWHGTTQYAVSSIEIDLGIAAAEQGSTAAANGRAAFESMSMAPTIKCTPLYTEAILNLKRNATKGRLLVQMGAGVLSSGVINCIGIAAEEAHASAVETTDDGGRVRQSVEFTVSDAVNFDASTASRFFQVARI